MRRASERVAYENACAAMLQPSDARWLFAQSVAGSLEGGRAAILTPPRRRELIAAAVAKGLREFDANLVIAIVQDSARRGELGDRAKALEQSGGLAVTLAPSLAMVRIPAKGPIRRNLTVILITGVLSVILFVVFVRLLLSS